MSDRSSFVASLVGILIIVLSACASSAVETEGVPARTPSATAVPTSTPSESTELVSTPTLVLPTSTPSFTPVPTIPAEEAYSLLAGWLQNSGDCQLPCWGGLIPGRSSSLEAYRNLTAFSSIADFVDLIYPTGGFVPLSYPKDDVEIRIDVMVHSKSDRRTIQVIAIFIRTLRELETGRYEAVYAAPAYNELVDAYILTSILSKYGPPTEIWVRADLYSTGTQETFSITLLYPEKGIFVRYNMLAERTGDQVRGCPSRSFVDLWLLSPEDAGAYQDILLSEDLHWEGNWPYTMPIQEAASMTVEEFYQAYNESVDRCLETPLDIWPKH